MEHLANNTSQKSGGTFGVREAEVLGGDSMRGAAEGNLRSACVCSSYRCMGGWGVPVKMEGRLFKREMGQLQ